MLPERKQNRKRTFNYNSPGSYFITICTKFRHNDFGEIKEEKMNLSLIGKLAEKFLLEIPQHFTGIEIGEYQIMPDHIHFIIHINSNKQTSLGLSNIDSNLTKISRRNEKLSLIINQYKSTLSRTIKKENLSRDFLWLRSFHDIIIQDENALFNIEKYIKNNVKNWPKS